MLIQDIGEGALQALRGSSVGLGTDIGLYFADHLSANQNG